ncbi:MAG TPA: DUF4340 domain-containing protein [Clostridiales bacterium]|nr:DUF4340 domain-containing protein [Clostridiales bacterium]
MITLTRQNKLLSLVTVFLFLFCCYLLLTKINQEKEEADDSVVAFLTDTDQISAVSFAAAGESFSFHEDNGSWALSEDSTFPLDTSALQTALNSLSEISATRELTKVTDFEDYGLSAPSYEIKLTSSTEDEITLAIGDLNTLTNAYYFRVNDSDSVYLVDPDVYDVFDCTLFDFIAADSIPALTDVASLTFENGEKTTFVRYADGYDGCYSPSYTWFAEDGDGLTAVDGDGVESLITTVSGMTWAQCVAYDVDQDGLDAYGLDDPAGTVSVAYRETSYVDSGKTDDEGNTLYDTDTEDKTFTLLIGDSIEKTDEDSGEAAVHYYAKTADSDLVYLIAGDTAKTLLSADAETCPVWELCQFDRTLLTAVEINDGGDTHELSIKTKNDGDNEDEGEETATASYTLDGKRVDGGAFLDELESIEGMKTTDTPEKAVGKTTLSLIFHQNREGFETVKMTFAKYDADYYLVSFQGNSSLLISTADFSNLSDAVTALVTAADE